MDSLGEFLRQGREEAGLTLEELAQRTRIRIENLEALEREDLDALPTDIYVRGFVKLACREIGLAPEDGLARYESLRSTAGPADEIIWSEEKEVAEPGWLERALRDPERVVRIATRAVKWGGLGLGGVLAVLVVMIGVRAIRSGAEPTSSAPVASAQEPVARAEAETPDPAPPVAEAPPAEERRVEPEPAVELALVEPRFPDRKPAGTIEAGDPVAAAELAAVEVAAEELAAEQAEADRQAVEQAEADRREAERRETERREAERLAVEQAEAERREAEQAEAERRTAERRAAEQAERLAVTEQAEAEPRTAPGAPEPAPPAVRTPRPASRDRLVLVVEALRPVDVEVLLDGIGLPRDKSLAAGERKTWKADSLFLLSASDAGAIRLTVDGIEVGVPGRDGDALIHHAVRPRH